MAWPLHHSERPKLPDEEFKKMDEEDVNLVKMGFSSQL
jgi:hypothetical protein